MASLTEQYRPRSWGDVVGQDKAVRQIQAVGRRGYGGRAYLLSGKSGTGKTTIARLIAAEVADPWTVEEMDAPDLTADVLRTIDRDMAVRPIGTRCGRAWIVNECHLLRAGQVGKLLTLLEPAGGLPEWVTFVFTTTADGLESMDGMDAKPFLSRCLPIRLSQRDLAPAFAQRAMEIARAENLDGQPLEKYVRLLRDCGLNMRAALQSIEAGEMLQ